MIFIYILLCSDDKWERWSHPQLIEAALRNKFCITRIYKV